MDEPGRAEDVEVEKVGGKAVDAGAGRKGGEERVGEGGEQGVGECGRGRGVLVFSVTFS